MTDVNFDALIETDGSVYIDPARDPAEIDNVGAALGDRARVFEATVVVNPHAVEDAVLGHIVARHLGLRRATVEIDLGRMTITPQLEPGARALFVAIAAEPEETSRVRALVEGLGSTLVGIAYLLEGEQPAIRTQPLG